MRQSLSLFDPDDDDLLPGIRPGWSKTKTDLQKKALGACERTYFKSPSERKRWNALEEKTRGATDEQILFVEWIKHNIELCEKANSRQITRVFATLLTMCENNERRIDWITSNREKVLADRKIDVEAIFRKREEAQ